MNDKCKNTYIGTTDKLTFQECDICGGRIHEEDCKTRRVEGKDCLGGHTEEEIKEAAGIKV